MLLWRASNILFWGSNLVLVIMLLIQWTQRCSVPGSQRSAVECQIICPRVFFEIWNTPLNIVPGYLWKHAWGLKGHTWVDCNELVCERRVGDGRWLIWWRRRMFYLFIFLFYLGVTREETQTARGDERDWTLLTMLLARLAATHTNIWFIARLIYCECCVRA